MKKSSYIYAGVLIAGYFIASLVGNTTAGTRAVVPSPKASTVTSVTRNQNPSPVRSIASQGASSPVSTVGTPSSKVAPTLSTIPSPVVSVAKASPLPGRIPSPIASSVTDSNPGTYTNVDGEQIQRPTYSDTVPAGASARCRDGSYSFSAHRQGTCSGHGGVAEWL